MPDTHCAICGEDWDLYGVKNGDMLKWEAELFLAGAGCPRCQGLDPELDDMPTPVEVLSKAYAPELPPVPEWKRPAAKIAWTCSGCRVAIVEEQHVGYKAPLSWVWQGGRSVHYLYGCSYPYSDYPEQATAEEKAPFEIAGLPYCEGCVASCSTCDTPIFRRSELQGGDTYDAGSSFLPIGSYRDGDAVCIDCYEKLCSECGAAPEDCTCDEEGETESQEQLTNEGLE
jgi:hypothetical protein